MLYPIYIYRRTHLFHKTQQPPFICRVYGVRSSSCQATRGSYCCRIFSRTPPTSCGSGRRQKQAWEWPRQLWLQHKQRVRCLYYGASLLFKINNYSSKIYKINKNSKSILYVCLFIHPVILII